MSLAVTGSPDFNQNKLSNPTSPVYDPGENASRLLMAGGSQSRSGRWLFATGFESGLSEFLPVVIGAGGSVTSESTITHQGAKSVKLQTGAVVGNSVLLNKYFFTQGENFGLEMFFSFQNIASSPNRVFYIALQGPGAVNGKRWLGQARISITGVNAGKVQYLNASGGIVDLYTINDWISDTPYFWHYIKLVFNTKTGLYSRIIFDELNIPLSVSGQELTSTTKYQTHEVGFTTLGAYQPIMYLDNYVITADEP